MNFNRWESFYKEIIKDFNYNIENDIKSANVLYKILQKRENIIFLKELNSLINNKEIIIFGAGPSLEKKVSKFKQISSNKLNIAVDGATTCLLKNNILPQLIITDLDGRIIDQLKASSMGSITVVHAHGDNIKKIKKYVPKFKGGIIGTISINPEPFDLLYNFGGFTDGDRAVYLVDHFNAKKINLIGFDFNNEIGRYSFTESKNINLKLRKLYWCKYLIDNLNIQNKINYI
jgi:uncharacterized Rossmann fold enzyme